MRRLKEPIPQYATHAPRRGLRRGVTATVAALAIAGCGSTVATSTGHSAAKTSGRTAATAKPNTHRSSAPHASASATPESSGGSGIRTALCSAASPYAGKLSCLIVTARVAYNSAPASEKSSSHGEDTWTKPVGKTVISFVFAADNNTGLVVTETQGKNDVSIEGQIDGDTSDTAPGGGPAVNMNCYGNTTEYSSGQDTQYLGETRQLDPMNGSTIETSNPQLASLIAAAQLDTMAQLESMALRRISVMSPAAVLGQQNAGCMTNPELN